MVNRNLQDSPRSKESIESVIEAIRQVLVKAYPDKEPEAFILDIDWHHGTTIISLNIDNGLTEEQLTW